MFPSRFEAWRGVRAFIERFCEESDVARETRLKANLVVEELFLNTVRHGHRGGSDAPVWITLARLDGHVRIVYEDNAGPFNPFGRSRQELAKALARPRREGGLGVILANALSSSADYAYLFGRNRISLEVA
jgi:anti-sigma regulatory factor (Ser/Thr protein kinase)